MSDNGRPALIPRRLINQMLAQAQQSPGAEICGLIGARDGHPRHCYPVANAARQPAHRYQMDPAGQIAAMRRLRERDENLYAIYHSHPDTPPTPSAEDLRQAAYPDALYIIVSLATEGTLELRAFRLRNDGCEAIDIVLE